MHKMKQEKVQYITEVFVTDPATHEDVSVSIYKTRGSGMFGIDTSFILTDEGQYIHSPFDAGVRYDLDDDDDPDGVEC